MVITKRRQIHIDDPTGITDEQWDHIWRRLKYIGYDFKDVNDAKEYVTECNWLNEDQSDEVLYCLGKKKLTRPTLRETNATIKRAVKRFGLTQSWELAGYLLPNGDMLDFSDGRYTRNIDHRQIHEVVTHSDNDTPGIIMSKFMNMGCIRCLPKGLDIITMPTQMQVHTMQNMLSEYDEIYAYISTPLCHTATTFGNVGGMTGTMSLINKIVNYLNYVD